MGLDLFVGNDCVHGIVIEICSACYVAVGEEKGSEIL